MNEKGYQGKGNIVYKFVTVLLLVIIIILLLFFNRFGKVEDSEKLVPTGNVDVFDIAVICTCEGDKCTYTDIDGNEIPVFNDETDQKLVGYVFVDDKSGNYLSINLTSEQEPKIIKKKKIV